MAALAPIPQNAVGLSAARALKNGDLRLYSAVEFTRGHHGVGTMIRRAAVCGLVNAGECEHPYAVIDVLDEDGSVILDFASPDRRAFQYLKRKLGWTVEPGD